jgi:hypothetical protein
MRAFCLLVLMLVGCTVDDLGKKRCEPGTKDPALQCVSGYECACSAEGCFCEPKTSVQSAPNSLVPDPNHRFLERLGVFED